MRTLSQSARELAAGTSSRSLVEECLARIADPAGEGTRIFLKVYAETARANADYIDHRRGRGAAPSRFAGIPISVKDLFDVAGDVTTSASVALRDAPPAAADAVAVARLRAAGLIPVGRTNMTEFAFTGLGINPHYDTPRNPYDRATGRIPGGSSSGAAVSVTDGMAVGALYDPRVLMRIVRGRDIDAADYIDLIRGRADLIRRVAAVTRDFDALVMPTVPLIASPLAELEAEDRYRKVNLLVLRNPTVANMLDRCAISLPCHLPGEAPVGLMLIGEHGGDRRLFEIAVAVEAAVSPVVRRA
jgi:Asp-tRNA(Asn)/Glu-tRNA(Gln) amidotransferase A subunit family amidase